jgi:endogenous inhibitor of DNA gyrase (YacG/DUF329 family)
MPPAPIRSKATCPICGKPPTVAARPFCSAGCRDRDLIQWLSDGYRIPGPPAEGDEIDPSSGLDS